jgi:broad specificity phosphatase PhoE
MLLAALLQAGPEAAGAFGFDNASITRLEWGRGRWRLKSYREIGHLYADDPS